MTKPKCGPLSHSSAKTLLGCEYKYWNYKVNKTPYDKDYEKGSALSIGSAFHWILEMSRHEKPKDIAADLQLCVNNPDILLAPISKPLVHAMVVKYLRLHKKMGFKILEIEFRIDTPEVTGRVDALVEDLDGHWWILDLKTAASFYPRNVVGLDADPQLNLYAAHKDSIAEIYNLNPDKFGGCRWRIATKPKLKQGKDESTFDYTSRLLGKVGIYDVPVPADVLMTQETLDRHVKLFKRSKQLFRKDALPSKNLGNCMAFFRPCEYWSQCHGKTYTESTQASGWTEEV